ncbi:MAG: T9SS type A sorting domain-containing protein [Bacteroidetes bacterium]|nr:MAG: T9SS type A sorting domain-containing protein [Bacteroidota bacterium]
MKYPYAQINVIFCLTCFLLILAGSLFAQAGMIDSTFGNNGVFLSDFNSGGSDRICSVMVQLDGKVVAVGNSRSLNMYSVVLIRLLEDGNYDPDFGTDGVVLSDFGDVDSEFYAAALDQDQNIVATGYGNDGDFMTARYLPDGSPDQSFGTNGIVYTDFFNDEDYANAIALQADGKIVTGGTGYDPNDPDDYKFALARFNSDGSLDTTFGNQGKVFTKIGPGDDEITSLVVQADGKVLAGGYTSVHPEYTPCLVRYHPDGTLDTGFGSGGIVVDTLSNKPGLLRWVGLMPDGRIVVVIRALGGNQNHRVSRYLANGTPDSTFNGTGKLILDQAIDCRSLRSGLVTPDGKLVIGGNTTLSYKFLVGRINPDGSIDTTFGNNGFVKHQVTGAESDIYSLATTPDGSLIAAGYGNHGVNTLYDFVLVKYLNDLQVGTLNFESPVQEVLVYPNPIVDQAVLGYEIEEGQPITIRLLDATGRPIQTFVQDQWQAPGSYQQPIAIPNALPSGFYLVQIGSPQGQVCIRVVK